MQIRQATIGVSVGLGLAFAAPAVAQADTYTEMCPGVIRQGDSTYMWYDHNGGWGYLTADQLLTGTGGGGCWPSSPELLA